MNKRKTKIYLFILFIATIIIMLNMPEIVNYTTIQIVRLNEDPIDLNTNIINNKYFGISSDGKNAEATTKGINEAINYASKNNIKQIKLEKGIYLIAGITTNYKIAGIELQSNINLDLNGSIIQQEPNSSTAYICMSIYECENVTVLNGIFIGDKESHTYNVNSTDEWGHGISIMSSKQVTLNNIEVYNMTGDGIYVSASQSTPLYETKQVQIENCNIHDNRRQGISIITGKNIIIKNNEIHHIKGTSPQSGIDLESNNRTELLSNIIIESNKFYDLGSARAIKIHRYIQNVDIINNEITGVIYGLEGKDTINISNNLVKNGKIYFPYNSDYKTNNLIVNNNELINSFIDIYNVNNAKIYDNKINNGNIMITSCNTIINNNSIQGSNDLIILKARDEDKEKEFLYSCEGNMNGQVIIKPIIAEGANYKKQ